MKRLTFLIVAILFITFGAERAEASNIKKVDVDVMDATSSYVKLNVKNRRSNSIYISQKFVLKKKVKGEWKKIYFNENVFFAKTIQILPNENKVIKIKWKNYFGKKLKKGKYKIVFIKTKKFSLK
ncbi:MAG: hypothetical protein E7254_10750 [Lachnospiraceae bacterium]|nr:hypothetical protein [Lachnospiraceae bacterium]